ncbi:MAG: hypothetical protein PHQ12_06355 [Chthoniobacteraceae bacterium]|nr:hypothetical protein [Chthoniobacteraceae bacterium]
MPPLPNLVCKACGYVNEGERVYCHGCGAKLDRELIISQQQPAVSTEQKQREIRKIMAPKNPLLPHFWKNLATAVLLAAVAAALVDAALPPEGVPAVAKELSNTPQLDVVLENLANTPDGQLKAVSEADLNAYLRKERFRKVPTWLTDTLPLRRAFVNLGEGGGRLGVEAALFQYPLYATLSGQVQSTGPGKLTAVCTGGAIGRLRIHPAVACYAGAALPTLLDSLKRERQHLDKLGSVEITQGRVILGAAKAAPPVPPQPAVQR